MDSVPAKAVNNVPAKILAISHLSKNGVCGELSYLN